MRKYLDDVQMPPAGSSKSKPPKRKPPAPRGGFGAADPEDDVDAEDLAPGELEELDFDDLGGDSGETAPDQESESPAADQMLGDASDDDLLAEAERRGLSVSKPDSLELEDSDSDFDDELDDL